MKTFTIDIKQEQADYLQRLGNEVDGMTFLIDRMFSNHAMDKDTSLFTSEAFKQYLKEYEEAYAMWEIAKQEFKSNYLDPQVKKLTGIDEPQYNWIIKDFTTLVCEVTMV